MALVIKRNGKSEPMNPDKIAPVRDTWFHISILQCRKSSYLFLLDNWQFNCFHVQSFFLPVLPSLPVLDFPLSHFFVVLTGLEIIMEVLHHDCSNRIDALLNLMYR